MPVTLPQSPPSFRPLAPPTPGAPEREAVRSMFDRIAPRYDLLNRLLSAGTDRRWRRACVDFLDLSAPARLLDLCTGTADLLIEALERDPRHRGVGLDLSAEMLRRADRKVLRRGLQPRASLAAADAERLPVAAARFDGALVAFGIRNVGDPAAALAELRRVLRPGGRLVVLEFGTPRGPLGALYRLYFERVLPRIGRLVSGDGGAYRYLPLSVARFPGPDGFCALLERAGFAAVSRRPLTLGIAWLYRGDVPA
ncbi:MAG TPA: ubiquinone/menaquinone biosynthesis methyltransferase [Vicinamibacteria bacterium]|nr:ubiquinone/menaquinone biosynthesis methyltransferase [Vicinamibacteria bacterium]